MDRDRAYCTVFDSNYAPRALALYRSLERAAGGFRLYAICMDPQSKALLDRLDAPRLVTVGIEEVEEWDGALPAVRPDRTAVEYSWTVASAACRFLLRRDASLEAITYLDADLCFFSSPEPLFEELGSGSILIVPHRTGDPRDALVHGVYNVGWVTMRRDANGLEAADWWRERCLEWCYARVEPGRFGDQKYLDGWPSRFGGVEVSKNVGAGLGPWNQGRHEITATTVDGIPLVFFHFSGLTLHSPGGAVGRLASRSGAYRRAAQDLLWTIRARHRASSLDLMWAPYVEHCASARRELIEAGAPGSIGLEPLTPSRAAATIVRERAPTWVRDVHLALYRRVMTRRATRPPRTRTALPRG
jgi:hypothetical protein